MVARSRYLIAYDSPSDSRRSRLLARIVGFGLDAQLSFHDCLLSPGERRELWASLAAIANGEEDRVMLVRIDPRSLRWRLGPSPHRGDEDGYRYVG